MALSSIHWKYPIRWETFLIIIEMLLVVALGFLPESAPYQISQVTINFICSMQYNTFRIAQGVPMATTFCTNHLRQAGIACCKALRIKESQYVKRSLCHLGMIGTFVLGAVISTVLCRRIQGRAIWCTLIPLGIALLDLLNADLHATMLSENKK